MKKARISVVTPTYNRKKSLKNNFESIQSQSMSVYEHVIVDNCSDDGTEELIEEYKKKVKYNVVFIREPDSGIYNAMNKGVAAATGEWVHILNSDDYLINNTAYEDIFPSDANDYDMIMASILHRNKEGNDELWIPSEDEWRIPHPGMIIKKEYYDRVGLYSEKYRIVSDAIWKFQNIPKSKHLIVKEPLTVMVLGGASTVKSKNYYWENFLCVLLYQPLPVTKKLKLSWKHLKKYIKAVMK